MTFSLAPVDQAIMPVRGFEGVDLESLPRSELVNLLRLASAGSRAWELAVASIAGEVARRSTIDDGPGGLARQQGFASPEQFVASVIGGGFGEGKKLVAAGTALTTAGPTGDGLRDGSLTAAKAELIASTIAALDGDISDLESRLARAARTLDYRHLKLVCSREAARFDAVQTEARERRQFAARGLELTEDASGMTHFRGQLGPEQAAFVRTYFDAQVKSALRAKRDQVDDRTASQIRADALVALATHGLDCTSPATGVKATVIVRVDRDQLDDEVGLATCDAISTPISITALRQIAVDASILPIVMGGDSQPLDVGREQRLFAWYQRMALAERDGGCAKCHAPVSHCITHHIRWWSKDGTTDLHNGVLLCVRCHTQVHHDRWDIEVDAENHVWFVTPAHLDPGRRRQLGGLAALTA